MRNVIFLGCVLFVGCGSGTGSPTAPTSTPTPTPAPSPAPTAATPVVLHDTLLFPTDSRRSGFPSWSWRVGYSWSPLPFDDFVPRVSASITSITWQGFYCNQEFTGNTIPTPAATSFRIFLANDDGGRRPVWSFLGATESNDSVRIATIPLADVRHELEFTRLDAACGVRSVTGDPAAYYRLSANLVPPMEVKLGTRYWIGIHALMPDARVSWRWRDGAQDNNYTWCYIDAVSTLFVDRAVAINGVTTSALVSP